jgi:hypothetical protein
MTRGVPIWPYDLANAPREPRVDPEQIRCFVIQPFTPKTESLDVFEAVRAACSIFQGHNQNVVVVHCHRADRPRETGIIMQDTWNGIRDADIVVADVTGANGNVMMEIGVASVLHPIHHVILLKDKADPPFLFDIQNFQHVLYERSLLGNSLPQELAHLLWRTLVDWPFTSRGFGAGANVPRLLPLKRRKWEWDVSKGDTEDIRSYYLTHRVMHEDGLEFGSPAVFPRSYLALGDDQIADFRLEVTMRFAEPTLPGDSWIGIGLRSQSTWAGYGYIFLVGPDGQAKWTPLLDLGRPGNPEGPNGQKLGDVATLQGFDPTSFHEFAVTARNSQLTMHVDGQGPGPIDMRTIPYALPRGRLLLQSFLTRARVSRIALHVYDDKKTG